ncbi:A24 family peptidase [Marinimicrobium sp. ABcell2]|uniref:prepilin peptidase n=1 Tax=Marinimicrobium sp. ABcell2 TaxID=3069751 RepID=UPI0027AF4034|nr:A24 family peptidase [Marinimicrobium sp. ABcell2]MDQ2077729.1 A24 family peptidase [Marinimicrobium sp. ABcell2]
MLSIPEVFVLYPASALIGAAILGLLVGSFLNVVIYRVPKMLEREWHEQCCELLEQEPKTGSDKPFNLVVPNSTCPHCGHGIKPWENIPIVSYLFLKGRCSACGASISARYPIIELVTGVLSFFVIYHFGANLTGLSVLVFTWALIALTMIDIDTQLLPDNITLPLLWLGLIVNSFGVFTSLTDALWGAVAGYLSLWSIYWLFKLLTGKEGMGFGDFKLLAALGAWMGWQMLPLIVLMSSFVGAAIGIGMILIRGRDRNIPIPFGPYLAIAGWLSLLWGDMLITQYLQFAAPTP